jgi:hypothetical protein
LDLKVDDALGARSATDALLTLDAQTVAEVRLSGSCDMATMENLQAALAAAENHAAALVVRENDLRLAPTDADLQSLQADGFVGESLAQLKADLQRDNPDLVRDALLHLARIQRDVNASSAGAAA